MIAVCGGQDMDDAHNLTPLVDAIGLLMWPGLSPLW